MTFTLCFLTWALVLALVVLTLPSLIWTHATAGPEARIRRLAAAGQSQRQIAAAVGCSRYRVRQALAVA